MFPVTRIKVSKSSNTWGVSSATLLLSTSVPLLSCVLFPIYLTSPTHVALSSSSKPFGILLDDCVFFHATLIFYLSPQIVNAGNLLPSVNVLFDEVLQRERASSQSSTGSRPQSAWSGFVGARGLIYPSISLIDLHRSDSLDQIGIIWGIQIPECLAPLYRLYKLDPARDRRFISNTFLVYSHAEIPFSLKGWILCPRASSSKAGKALLLKFNVLCLISACVQATEQRYIAHSESPPEYHVQTPLPVIPNRMGGRYAQTPCHSNGQPHAPGVNFCFCFADALDVGCL